MKKERSASRKKPGHADSKIEKKKKDLYKGELNSAKDHNTRDISFIFGIKTPQHSTLSTKKHPRANFTVIFSSIIFYLLLALKSLLV